MNRVLRESIRSLVVSDLHPEDGVKEGDAEKSWKHSRMDDQYFCSLGIRYKKTREEPRIAGFHLGCTLETPGKSITIRYFPSHLPNQLNQTLRLGASHRDFFKAPRVIQCAAKFQDH